MQISNISFMSKSLCDVQLHVLYSTEFIFASRKNFFHHCATICLFFLGRKNSVMLATASMYLRKLSSQVKYGQLISESFQGGKR